MDGTGSGSFPVTSFGTSGVEPSGSATSFLRAVRVAILQVPY